MGSNSKVPQRGSFAVPLLPPPEAGRGGRWVSPPDPGQDWFSLPFLQALGRQEEKGSS